MKYLLVALVLAVAVWVLLARARRVKSKPPPGTAAPERASPPSESESSVAMVACCHCGVHLPQSDAVFDMQGQVFCSPEHLREGPRKR